MSTEQLVFNGIDGDSGDYLLRPLSPEEVVKLARGETVDEAVKAELEDRIEDKVRVPLSVTFGVDPTNLAEAGWGVIFAWDDRERAPAIMEALRPLLDLRQAQAGGSYAEGGRYREFTGGNSYRPGDTKDQFLARFGVGPGPVNPQKLPYYLLIVADPETIPYRFQYLLDVQFSVGRIYFDTIEEYANYAASVVAAERGHIHSTRRLALFGVQNPDDAATDLSTKHLIHPLQMALAQRVPDWVIESSVGQGQATKEQLSHLLGGSQTPGLLFTASHGMGFPNGSPRQLKHQGALLCQEWPGPRQWKQAIPEEFYFSADDVAADANLAGSVVFSFACYGAGTPQLDDFDYLKQVTRQKPIAPKPFVARLPQRLLGRPKGGALAVIGHVERAWSYSFHWGRAGGQTEVFEATLHRMMAGEPVGLAVEFFNERYAELSTMLHNKSDGLITDLEHNVQVDLREVAGVWTATNDARSYIIIGDPAVHLPLRQNGLEPANVQEAATVQAGAPTAPQEPPVIAQQVTNNQANHKWAISEETLDSVGKEEDRSHFAREEISFLPPPEPPVSLKAIDEELYNAWRAHIVKGFENNERMFGAILDAVMVPYYTTIWMYRILFGVGVLAFLAAAVVSLWTGEAVFALIFGGLSVGAFLSYFLGRPLQSLEENINFITWLGLIYNTYWTRLVYMMDHKTVQTDLTNATHEAIAAIKDLLATHQKHNNKRPGA